MPEQVLVIETVGSIRGFVRAVKKIDGLEWLAEYELDDLPPAHGFEDRSKPDMQLKGQLFLVMTDQQALDQLQSLFKSMEGRSRNLLPQILGTLEARVCPVAQDPPVERQRSVSGNRYH